MDEHAPGSLGWLRTQRDLAFRAMTDATTPADYAAADALLTAALAQADPPAGPMVDELSLMRASAKIEAGDLVGAEAALAPLLSPERMTMTRALAGELALGYLGPQLPDFDPGKVLDTLAAPTVTSAPGMPTQPMLTLVLVAVRRGEEARSSQDWSKAETALRMLRQIASWMSEQHGQGDIRTLTVRAHLAEEELRLSVALPDADRARAAFESIRRLFAEHQVELNGYSPAVAEITAIFSRMHFDWATFTGEPADGQTALVVGEATLKHLSRVLGRTHPTVRALNETWWAFQRQRQ